MKAYIMSILNIHSFLRTEKKHIFKGMVNALLVLP